MPTIRNVSFVESVRIDMPPSWIDIDQSGQYRSNGALHRDALDQIKLFDAINLIRNTPPFDNRINLRDVRVAVMDTGFNPPTTALLEEFRWEGQRTAQFLKMFGLSTPGFRPTTQFEDASTSHGTQVASGHCRGQRRQQHSRSFLNSLLDRHEAPFPIYVYGLGGDDESVGSRAAIAAALDHIDRGPIYTSTSST